MGINSGRFRLFLESGLTIVMDGAMGTELQRRGLTSALPLWSAGALMEDPAEVKRIHLDHIASGARLITTNTFRTTPRALGMAGMAHRAGELTALAVELARDARGEASRDLGVPEAEVFIAGSVAPLEDCYSPELVPDGSTSLKEHRMMTRALARFGVDFVLVETMNTVSEAAAAVRAARETELPVAVSFTLSPGGDLLSGEGFGDALKAVTGAGAEAVMVNCIPAPDMDGAVERLAALAEVPFGAYANMGIPDEVEGWRAKGMLTPGEYAGHVVSWVESGASLVGGCCGTTPEHVRAMAEAVKGR